MTDAPLRRWSVSPNRAPSASPAMLPPKAPHTRRVYAFDFTTLLAQLGRTGMDSAAIAVDPPLTRQVVARDATTLTVEIGGGIVGNLAPRLCIALVFTDGAREDVVLAQPITAASPDIPDDALTVNSQVVTVAYQPMEVGHMPILAGGPQATDLVVLVRPGVNGAPDSAGRLLYAQFSGGNVASLTAGASVSGHRAVMVDGLGLARHADPSNPATYNLAGLSLGAAAIGGDVLLALPGETVAEPSWAWSPGLPVFVGPAGTLTQTPPASGVLHQIGQAMGPTVLLLDPFPPINRN